MTGVQTCALPILLDLSGTLIERLDVAQESLESSDDEDEEPMTGVNLAMDVNEETPGNPIQAAA